MKLQDIKNSSGWYKIANDHRYVCINQDFNTGIISRYILDTMSGTIHDMTLGKGHGWNDYDYKISTCPVGK